MNNIWTLTFGICLTASTVVAAQTPTATPIDRLALRGAVACTWGLSDSPQQCEVFELVRKFFIAVGRRRVGHTFSEDEEQATAIALLNGSSAKATE
jgi:hypothetical protein